MCLALGASVLSCQRCEDERRNAYAPASAAAAVRLTSAAGESFDLTLRAVRREPGANGFERWTLVAERATADGHVRALVARFRLPVQRGRSTRVSPEGSDVTVRFVEQGVLNEASMVLRDGLLHQPDGGAPTLELSLAKRFATDRTGQPHARGLPSELRFVTVLPR